MKLGMVGLGKMGANMTVRLIRGGHQVVGFARTKASSTPRWLKERSARTRSRIWSGSSSPRG